MNRVREKIHTGEEVLGTMLSEVSTSNIVRILKTAGFEYVIIDCEHGYFDFSQIAALIAVGNGYGISVIIRIPEIRREFITKVMDMGAAGLLVPMVNTAEEARQVVAYAKYAPLGMRGVSTQRAHTNYNPPPLEEYMKRANEETILMVQIETKEGLKNLTEIAAVSGIDSIMIGPNDLAVDMGMPGKIYTEDMLKNVAYVAAEAEKNGKSSGIITSNIEMLHKCREQGMNVFSCDSEVGMLMKGARRTVENYWK